MELRINNKLIVCILFLLSCNNEVKYYYPDGKIHIIESVSKGKLNGLKTVYYENGNIQWVGEFKNDTENGVYRTYYENGSLKVETYFIKGIQNGVTRKFRENGTLFSKGVVINGNAEGNYDFFYENGEIKKREYYEKDDIKYYKEYYKGHKLKYWWGEIKIDSEKDTLIEGEKYMAKIFFPGPWENESIRFRGTILEYPNAQIGELPSKGTEAYFESGPAPTGNFTVKIFVYVNNSDSCSINIKRFCVLSKKQNI